ncbi:MAG: hypothetical protein JXR07_09210 [Reichenbachiella sp.]
MEEESQNSYHSPLFVLSIVVAILILHFFLKDISLIIPEHNKEIVLIYDIPAKIEIDNFQEASTQLKSDSSLYATQLKDADTLLVDSLVIGTKFVTNNKETSSVDQPNSDSLYFSTLIDEFIGTRNLRENRPVIRYYAKPLDLKNVYNLKQFGYYIHERASTGLEGHSSNAIFYGDSVKNEEVLLIAYSLISNGMDIKEISRSKYSWKYNAIEIGTDTTIMNEPSIEISQLRKLLSAN